MLGLLVHRALPLHTFLLSPSPAPSTHLHTPCCLTACPPGPRPPPPPLLRLPRFSAIQNTCSGAVDKASYGVDPVFKMGSTLYNPDLFDPQDAFMLGFYNCSQLAKPTYDLIEYPTNLTINPAPYCAELFNPR